MGPSRRLAWVHSLAWVKTRKGTAYKQSTGVLKNAFLSAQAPTTAATQCLIQTYVRQTGFCLKMNVFKGDWSSSAPHKTAGEDSLW